MNAFKNFCKDFPTQGGSVVIALLLIFFTGIAVIGRLAVGADFPDGYDGWLLFLGALATGTWAAMIGKRLSDFRYKEAGTTTVNVESAGTVKAEGDVTVEAPVPDPGNLVRVERVSAPTARDLTRRESQGERGEP